MLQCFTIVKDSNLEIVPASYHECHSFIRYNEPEPGLTLHPQNAPTLSDGTQPRLSVSFAGRERERGQASHAKTLSRRRRLREGGVIVARPPATQTVGITWSGNGGASFAFSVHSPCLQGKTSDPLAGGG